MCMPNHDFILQWKHLAAIYLFRPPGIQYSCNSPIIHGKGEFQDHKINLLSAFGQEHPLDMLTLLNVAVRS